MMTPKRRPPRARWVPCDTEKIIVDHEAWLPSANSVTERIVVSEKQATATRVEPLRLVPRLPTPRAR